MLLKKETINIQSELASYCRDGKLRDIQGAKTERLPHYRRLVYNIVNNAMEQAYPITLQILSSEEWDDFIYSFFSEHDPQSSEVWKLPYELYLFAKSNAWNEKLNRSYLLDLLYFEWLEIEVYCMPDGEVVDFHANGEIVEQRLVVNPDHRLIHLQYPVHKKAWKELEKSKGSFFVLVFRDPNTGKVHFMELSSFFALVFERLSASTTELENAIRYAAERLNVPFSEELIQKSVPFIKELLNQKAVLGFQQ